MSRDSAARHARRSTRPTRKRVERRPCRPPKVSVFACLLLAALPALGATQKKLTPQPKVTVSSKEPTVTLDVKDADVADIMASMQKQCGVKNLVIDPGVQAKGTFYFRAVPCRTAFSVVLKSLGLDSVTYSSHVVTVGTKR